VTKSTTIEYVRADDAELVAVPVSRQPRAPTEAQPVVTTFFLALSAATYFGTLTEPVPDTAPVPAAVAAAWAALAGGDDTVAAGVGEPELQADNARASGRAATAPPTASLTGVLLAVLMITSPFLFSGDVTVRR
jgi:ABC-type nitrate/sulfonate/bicarbonate transport system permease component